MPSYGVGLKRRWLTVLIGLLMLGGLLVTMVVFGAAPARGVVGLDSRVPGPSNPVGPVDFVFTTTYNSRVVFDSGGAVVLQDVRFRDGFTVRNGTSVTVRDCYIHSPEGYGVEVAFDGSSLVMEDCQIGSYDEPEPGLIAHQTVFCAPRIFGILVRGTA